MIRAVEAGRAYYRRTINCQKILATLLEADGLSEEEAEDWAMDLIFSEDFMIQERLEKIGFLFK